MAHMVIIELNSKTLNPKHQKGLAFGGPAIRFRLLQPWGSQQSQNISFKGSFPKIGGSTLGVPIRRILAFLGVSVQGSLK